MALGWRKEYLRYKGYYLNIVTLYKRRRDLRMFLEIILSLVSVSFFTAFALRPTALAITELISSIETKESIIAKMDTKIQNINLAQSVFQQNQSTISKLNEAVPIDPNPDRFVRQMEGLATRFPVNFLGLSIGEVVLIGEDPKVVKKSADKELLPGDARGLNFSISVTGSYVNLIGFLGNIQNMRRPVKIEVVNLTSSRTSEDSQLVLVVVGQTPYLSEGN